MEPGVIVAIISGVASIVATVLTILGSNKRTQNMLQINQAVTETRLDSLTEEVRKHNNFAERIPRLEQKIEYLEKDVADLKGGTRK